MFKIKLLEVISDHLCKYLEISPALWAELLAAVGLDVSGASIGGGVLASSSTPWSRIASLLLLKVLLVLVEWFGIVGLLRSEVLLGLTKGLTLLMSLVGAKWLRVVEFSWGLFNDLCRRGKFFYCCIRTFLEAVTEQAVMFHRDAH